MGPTKIYDFIISCSTDIISVGRAGIHRISIKQMEIITNVCDDIIFHVVVTVLQYVVAYSNRRNYFTM